MNKPIIQSQNLKKSYRQGQVDIDVLRGINLSIEKGARIAIVGPSGSGKSSLLQLLGGLDLPSGGKVSIQGEDWQSLTEGQRC